MKHLLAAIAFCAGIAAAGFANARPHDWRTGVAQTPTFTVPFEMDYQIAQSRLLRLHFSVRVPLGDGLMQTQTRGMAEGNIYEARFLTPDGALLEYLTISSGTVEGTTTQELQQSIYDVIVQFVYPSIGFGENAEVLGGREAVIGGQTAVEFMAISREPEQAMIVARIVGVVSPNNRDVLFFLQQSLPDNLGLSGVNEMSLTYAGAIADSVQFIAYRGENNEMIPF